MRAGQLRHTVEFQKRATTQDSFGQQAQTWTSFMTMRAAVESLTARELMAAQAMNLQATDKVIVRYTPLLENPVEVAAMRIVYRGRIFDIKGSANQNEMNREIWLMVSEGLDQG